MHSGQPKGKLRPLGIVALFVILAASVVTVINTAKNWSATAAARKLKNPVPPTAEAIAAGKQVYIDHCRSCHGEKGDGRGKKAAELSVAPGDFTEAAPMRRLTDGELFWQITRGRLPMPAFADKLTDEQRWQAVDYIRTFAERPPAANRPSGADGASGEASAVRLTSLLQAPRKPL